MDNKKFCEHFLHIILKESERMQGLIEDLLDLSKIEQQGFKLNMGTVDMKEICLKIFIWYLIIKQEKKKSLYKLMY